ncbi:MAG: hypothetical protein COT85_07980 [Chlamydiae bacterium CG10_big_fil_rev_8_21_14_0_10_42_34]|nr:MAG: hypothetical protein COT85_07980 [Chlamydiae bacterium CG10_big_fil_rev_8_21_14_0_10_42_34]
MNPVITSSQIEQNLRPTLLSIDAEMSKWFTIKNMTYLTGIELKQKAKTYPWWVAAGVAAVVATGVLMHPLVIGSIACFNVYRIESYNDLYSSNIDTANNATQLYSNLGHSVGYLVEGIEITALSTAFLIRSSYLRAAAKKIDEIYNAHIAKAQTSEEQNFLWDLKKEELSRYGFSLLAFSDEIQEAQKSENRLENMV